ncbi:hypothetical protein P691DRAFT_681624 [Macrolepiota fuliginosa MF-IS2]|uniref:DUF8040 domain-containing protein n=1 Tax=Macrolepiota fuliginosa MF-IS2 TaxID=1400762 RepID=A0A9P5X2V8_9AGAR|nr:hypothetical protein P691DRAFT_681624 [Macrolepiota fuliginosa MF-IS2]
MVTIAAVPSLLKTPQHTSILTGYMWVEELLAGHPVQFHNMLGMSKHVYLQLIDELSSIAGLKPSKHVTQEEQVAIFLHMAHVGASN